MKKIFYIIQIFILFLFIILFILKKKEKFVLLENDKRVDFYLGKNLLKGNFKINDKNLVKIWDLKKNIPKSYYKPLKKLLRLTGNIENKFYFNKLDVEEYQCPLYLSKNRSSNNKDSVLLKSLNFNRHWQNYYKKQPDIDFDDKINKIWWRGTTTGTEDRTPNRFNLVQKWFNVNDNIDVGFYSIVQGKDQYQKYIKKSFSIKDILKIKYILSVEGNDKDSGLNWKLNSNSLVIMPKPRITTWLMETTLIPNYHYVLVKDDFSDLEKKLKWCNKHQDRCKEIIKNANTFMNQFSDIGKENNLELNVIKKYFDILNKNQINLN